MPQIRPITDLRNTTEISELCHARREPLFITKNGYGDMVIMSTETFEEYERLREAFLVAANVRRGLDEIDRGEGKPARSVLNGLRSRYDL